VPYRELLNKIKTKKWLKEGEVKKYFQQLIDGIDYFHSRNVYYRDLKFNNLLIDADGNLKIGDFGIKQQHGSDGLLYTMYGPSSYVALEVISGRGYNGTSMDLWSCSIFFLMLLTEYLSF
jgi:serine/threonine protein kinase